MVEVFHAERLRFANEEVIEIRAIPMRVRDLITWAGGDKQLVAPLRIVEERFFKLMLIKRKTALQSAGDLRIGLLPASPLGQWQQTRQIVSQRQFFEQQVGQRR